MISLFLREPTIRKTEMELEQSPFANRIYLGIGKAHAEKLQDKKQASKHSKTKTKIKIEIKTRNQDQDSAKAHLCTSGMKRRPSIIDQTSTSSTSQSYAYSKIPSNPENKTSHWSLSRVKKIGYSHDPDQASNCFYSHRILGSSVSVPFTIHSTVLRRLQGGGGE